MPWAHMRSAPFRQHEEAVSPIMGVLLMVSVTVVLGTVVFLVATNQGKTDSTAPGSVTFARTNNVLQVVNAPALPKMDWYNDVKATGTCAAHLKITPVSTGMTVDFPTAVGTPVSAGDKLSGCAQGEQLALALTRSSTVFYSVTF